MNAVSAKPSGASARQRGRFVFWLLGGHLLLAGLLGFALYAEWRHIDDNVEILARERGSVLFRLVELVRDWNAQHGGVYVVVTDQTQPNPYLVHPRRDVETTNGLRLTMVNPAFMTRQIAEIAEKADGVKYHITSLKPIRPANAADLWEREALRWFEQGGGRERLSLIQTEAGPVHRYMAPLLVKEACLRCHGAQGYKVGDIRGGISISMPAEKLLDIRDRQRSYALWDYGLTYGVISALFSLILWRSRRYVLHLRGIAASQEQEIATRTRELSQANAHLTEEVAERRAKEAQIAESEARFRSVIESSQDGIVIMSAPEFKVVFANERAGSILGYPASQMVGRGVMEFVHPDDRGFVQDRLARRERGELVVPTSRLRFVRPGSHDFRVTDVFVSQIEIAGNPLRQWMVNVKDVTEQLDAERKLQIAAAVMDNAAEAIVVTDGENRIMQVNPAFTAITGYRPHEILGQNPRLLSSGRHPPEFFRDMWRALQRDGRWEGEIWNRRRDGSVYAQWLSITTIKGEGGVAGGRHVATFIDITQRKEAEELLRHRANSDPLTDLPNRALFYDRLQMVWTQARRYQHLFALLYIDLDHFKAVNDTLGHAAGDDLLIEAARRLTLAVRESDTVARLGGDEFAVILAKTHGILEVEEVAQRIVNELARPFALDAGPAQVSGSVGIALYPEHGDDLDVLRRHADMALYAVKEAGRNGYRVYLPGMGH